MSHAALWAEVAALTESGELRRLSGPFARFIASLGHDGAPLMLACVLLSDLEGRGHSCLMLAELAADPRPLLRCGAAHRPHPADSHHPTHAPL